MEHGRSGTDRGHLERYADKWLDHFSKEKSTQYRHENTPFWVNSGQDPTTSRQLLKAFLKDLCEDTDSYLYQAVEIEDFCFPADLALLKNGDSEQVQKPMALLDDRNEEGKRTATCGTCRPSKGPLSAHQLYRELERQRFADTGPVTLDLGRPENTANNTNEPDADRRLIYVADVDCWSILAIIATASKRQAGYFRDFIYRHLAFKTFLGVQIPIGTGTYALELHIPFYVWRQSPCLIEDQRQRAHETPQRRPLRRSRDLNFLKLNDCNDSSPALEDCIYEAQISCIIAGFDERSWVALSFVDTYYKGEEDNTDSVKYYAEHHERSIGSYKKDPLARGQLDANTPIWKPREYFLRVLDCRIDQVGQEWHNVVSRLLQILQPYTHDYLLPSDNRSPDDTESFNKEVHQVSNRTVRFLQQVISHLSKTIDAWDSFQKRDIGYFLRLESTQSTPEQAGSRLHNIEKNILDLRVLRQEVEDQKRLMESIEREISKHLQQDSNKIANLQQQSGEHMKLLSIIALAFTPFAISSGLFSLDSDMLPFPKTLPMYFLITFCLGIIMLTTSTVMLKWTWHYSLRDWACTRKNRDDARLGSFRSRSRRGGVSVDNLADNDDGSDRFIRGTDNDNWTLDLEMGQTGRQCEGWSAVRAPSVPDYGPPQHRRRRRF